jgi:Glycosyl hydrolase-like 10
VRGGGTLSVNDWRRENVNMLIRDIYRRTKAIKPWVKVGISPFGIWRPGTPPEIAGFDAYDKLYADSRKWLREGWVDYFVPQLYWPIAQTAQSYPTLLRWWMSENTTGRHVWPGHNTSRAAGTVWAPDELLEQIRLTRSANAGGDIHFSMRALMPANGVRRDSVLVGVATQPPAQVNAAALADRLQTQLYAEPALVPGSPWLSKTRPARPLVALRTDAATREHVVRLTPGDNRRVSWWTVRVHVDDRWRTWVLPGSQRRVTVAGAGSAAPDRVVVTAVDRFGTESRVVEVGRR